MYFHVRVKIVLHAVHVLVYVQITLQYPLTQHKHVYMFVRITHEKTSHGGARHVHVSAKHKFISSKQYYDVYTLYVRLMYTSHVYTCMYMHTVNVLCMKSWRGQTSSDPCTALFQAC